MHFTLGDQYFGIDVLKVQRYPIAGDDGVLAHPVVRGLIILQANCDRDRPARRAGDADRPPNCNRPTSLCKPMMAPSMLVDELAMTSGVG